MSFIGIVLTAVSLSIINLPLEEAKNDTTYNDRDSAVVISENPVVSNVEPRLLDTNIVIPSLDFSNIPLRDAFTALNRAYKLSVYIDSSVTGNISLRLENVSLNDALLFIIKEYDLAWERTGDILKVFKRQVPPEPPPEPFIEINDNKLNVRLDNVPISKFIDTLILLSGYNIILDNGAGSRINGHLVDIEFEKGLKALLNSSGFTLSEIDGIYHVDMIQGEVGPTRKSMRYSIECGGDSISIDVRNIPLEDILATLSDECGLRIISHGQIEGNITANYQERSVDRVLASILKGTSYSFKEVNGVYYIGDKSSQDLFTSKLIRFKHIRNESILDLIPATIGTNISIKRVPDQNGVIVTGPSTAIIELEDFLNKIDLPPAQVLFEAVVVDFNISKFREFNLTANNTAIGKELAPHDYFPGIDYSTTGDRLNDHIDNIEDYLNISNIGRLSSDFFLRLKWLEQEGIANIRSRPQIAALNGHEASIKIGTSQYYLLESQTIYPSDQTNLSTQTSQRFEVIEADMSLEVIPWVTKTGDIIVSIQPEFNTPSGGFDPDIPPTINHRILKSTVRLRDGETIVLGGMIQDIENATIKKVPILGSLPIIGRIFQSRSSTNTKATLMVYLTPHVYYGSEGSVDIEEVIKSFK